MFYSTLKLNPSDQVRHFGRPDPQHQSTEHREWSQREPHKPHYPNRVPIEPARPGPTVIRYEKEEQEKEIARKPVVFPDPLRPISTAKNTAIEPHTRGPHDEMDAEKAEGN